MIEDVEFGECYPINRRGRPFATLGRHAGDKLADAEWVSAYRRMLAHLDQGARLGGLRVEREALYDR